MPWRMMPPCSWVMPGMKPGTSSKTMSGTLRHAEAHKAGALLACLDVQNAGQHGGLLGNDADGPAAQPRKSRR